MLVAHHAYPPGLIQRKHAHSTMSVTLVLEGTVRERVGRVEETAGPLSLVVKPAAVEHENAYGPGRVRTLQIGFAPHEASELVRVRPSMRTWRWVHCGVPVRPFLVLALAAQRGAPAHVIEMLAVDALAVLDAMAPARGDPPRVLRDVRARLDGESPRPSVSALAHDAGMHPVYLARIFRRYFGLSMSQYVRRVRLRRAIGQLAAECTSLSKAAHHAGFSDHAHMCRAFRTDMGMTPSDYRSLVAG